MVPGVIPAWMALADRLHRTRGLGVLVTVFAAGDGAPCRPGDRFVLELEGPGLLPPPGAFRDRLMAAMRQALDRGLPGSVAWPAAEGGLAFLVEPILPPFALWVIGAGEHTRPLARLAKGLGWWLGLVDHRPALATAERFPEADRIVVGHPPEVLEGLPLDPRSAALVVSHVYEIDKAALAALLAAPLGYLGLQGNRTRSARILRELEAEGLVLSPARAAMLHWPAGLDLGGETPEAIALSMISEIQAALAGHGGGSLRDQTGAIHGRGRAGEQHHSLLPLERFE
jgi:xanthine/CO dehydrogenase XdhC/CoxF family maturation factor